jgi:hypothetical protein
MHAATIRAAARYRCHRCSSSASSTARRALAFHSRGSEPGFGRPRAQRQQFASTCQRLKAVGWRGIELGPVELLLNAVKGFFADLAPLAQALQCRALGGDRA